MEEKMGSPSVFIGVEGKNIISFGSGHLDLIDWRIDFDEKIRECKAVIINSPSNPTGRVENIKTLKR